MTPNEDGTNDALIIANLEDFDKVELKIFNRWGSLVYENDAYQNDWKGIDKGGNKLNDGTYFYLVTPLSEKYEYDDQEKTQYTLHGFFQLIIK
jgi:gliding motility-associated-like protein